MSLITRCLTARLKLCRKQRHSYRGYSYSKSLLSGRATTSVSRSPVRARHNRLGQIDDAHKAPRMRRGPLIIGGIAVYCFTLYGSYLYVSFKKAIDKSKDLVVPEDVSSRYNDTAKNYDNDVDRAERLMGLGWLRQRLARKAFGDVLEVSVGTGRNASYYDLGKCKSITMVDCSPEMVAIARKKFNATRPHYESYSFHTQSANDPLPSPPPPGFDTILQTMGLCSTPNPSALLAHLGALLNRTGGQILLLEHGRSHYDWLNRLLDDLAPAHADRHGCWWNKDIGKLVKDSGLEVVTIKRYHFGTTWWIELKPKQEVQGKS